MNYLTEEKFEQEIEALRLREFAVFKDDMLGFKKETKIQFLKNDREHDELKGMLGNVQTTVDKIYQLLDRDTHTMEELDRDLVATHARIDRVENYLGPAFAQAVASE